MNNIPDGNSEFNRGQRYPSGPLGTAPNFLGFERPFRWALKLLRDYDPRPHTACRHCGRPLPASSPEGGTT